MTRWEYKVASFVSDVAELGWDNKELKAFNLEDGLRELGYQGWELVSFTPIGIAKVTGSNVLIFKRPRT